MRDSYRFLPAINKRTTWFILGIVLLLSILILGWLFLKNNPQLAKVFDSESHSEVNLPLVLETDIPATPMPDAYPGSDEGSGNGSFTDMFFPNLAISWDQIIGSLVVLGVGVVFIRLLTRLLRKFCRT